MLIARMTIKTMIIMIIMMIRMVTFHQQICLMQQVCEFVLSCGFFSIINFIVNFLGVFCFFCLFLLSFYFIFTFCRGTCAIIQYVGWCGRNLVISMLAIYNPWLLSKQTKETVKLWTRLHYHVCFAIMVLEIVNINGQLVRIILEMDRKCSNHQLSWYSCSFWCALSICFLPAVPSITY